MAVPIKYSNSTSPQCIANLASWRDYATPCVNSSDTPAACASIVPNDLQDFFDKQGYVSVNNCPGNDDHQRICTRTEGVDNGEANKYICCLDGSADPYYCPENYCIGSDTCSNFIADLPRLCNSVTYFDCPGKAPCLVKDSGPSDSFGIGHYCKQFLSNIAPLLAKGVTYQTLISPEYQQALLPEILAAAETPAQQEAIGLEEEEIMVGTNGAGLEVNAVRGLKVTRVPRALMSDPPNYTSPGYIALWTILAIVVAALIIFAILMVVKYYKSAPPRREIHEKDLHTIRGK